MATATAARLTAATARARYRAESEYQRGQRDALAVIAELTAECDTAVLRAAVACLAKSARTQFRRTPGAYYLGKLDALCDVRG